MYIQHGLIRGAHGRVTNHINMLADISGFGRHFDGQNSEYRFAMRNLLIMIDDRHVEHAQSLPNCDETQFAE